ncbi:alpha/beta fold hydrolase [Qipengyuania sediminis]|uniref:alpha/beta fold hydrolase n=1 Tax=Qipengyuania sediminis TaxID=1532023 RepID=UPI00105A936D|nr:alpha/beta hydrolase [Qipengyuania sediminis]
MFISDQRIIVGTKTLFARRWQPISSSSNAPVILLFHESLGCVELWRSFPKKLAIATGLSVIAYDRLGFGRSDAHESKLPLDFVADEAKRHIPLIQSHIGFSNFIACGHSIGGAMALEAAAHFRDRCDAVITLGAQAFVEEQTIVGLKLAKKTFSDYSNISRLEKYHGDKAEWVVNAWLDTWLDPAFAEWTLDKAISLACCPVLAIHGERDEYGSCEHPRRIAGHKGELALLPNVGHVPHRENGEVVIELVTRFLDRYSNV